MQTEFFKTVTAYFGEALRILGPMELGLATAAFVALVTLVAWPAAKLIDRNESHFGAALSSGLTFAMVGGVLGLSFLALQLKDLCATGTAPVSMRFMLCAGICGLLTLVMVHGAFGSAWWRSLVMLPILLVAAVGAGWISHTFILGGRTTQLPVLAAQTAGLKTDAPSLITSEPLKKIAAQYGIRVEREELAQRQEQLVKTYHSLQAKRARVNPADQAEVAAFTGLANAYSAEKAYIQKRSAELDALEAPAFVSALE